LSDPEVSAYTRVLSKKQNWNDPDGYELEIVPAIDKLNFCGGSTSGDQQGAVTYSLDDQWHHIVAVRKGETTAFYIDNEYFGSDNYSVSAKENDVPLIIGATPAWNGFFKGAIDELILFNRALSEAEINDLHNFNYDFK